MSPGYEYFYAYNDLDSERLHTNTVLGNNGYCEETGGDRQWRVRSKVFGIITTSDFNCPAETDVTDCCGTITYSRRRQRRLQSQEAYVNNPAALAPAHFELPLTVPLVKRILGDTHIVELIVPSYVIDPLFEMAFAEANATVGAPSAASTAPCMMTFGMTKSPDCSFSNQQYCTVHYVERFVKPPVKHMP